MKEITEIPQQGWGEGDIGKKVRIRMSMGTIVEDIIVRVTLPFGSQDYIGPSQEVGMVIARVAMFEQHLQAELLMREAINRSMEDLE